MNSIEVDEPYTIAGHEASLLYYSCSWFWRVWVYGLGYVGLGTSREEALEDARINLEKRNG